MQCGVCQMTTIAVICPGLPERTPSTHYRFGQYRDLWREQGVELTFVPKQELLAGAGAWPSIAPQAMDVLEKADVIVNQKCLLSSHLFRQIKRLGKPLVFDFDDLIWHRAGNDYSLPTKWKLARRLALWTNGVDQVICANTYLQAALLKKTGAASVVVPMSLDLDLWCPKSDRLGLVEDGLFQVGWTGSPEYHWLLRKLVPALRQAQQQEPLLRFSIHSGVDPQLDLDYAFVPWQKGNEPDYVKSLDIGLLPMDPDSIFSLGKSPIKGLQYLACGVVPVGNFCGASLDFLRPSNGLIVDQFLQGWVDAILSVSRDPRRQMELKAQGLADVHLLSDRRRVGESLLRLLLVEAG